ncbi:MAG: 1-acyl-sn-glycerol-3-phosphate acyltransferase [Candidatus Pacebacteria bacterium]|nr:1-acyl-sn-glycerol-3-phosphate acyltransferase [Candidatus Paceibacterota bacterium]
MNQTATRSNPIIENSKTDLISRDSNGVALFLDKSTNQYVRQTGKPTQNAGSHQVSSALYKIYKLISKKAYNLRCSLIKFYSGTTQFFSWFIFWPLYNSLFKIEYHGRENLKKLKGPLIMVSNHNRFYDSFLYRIIVGLFSPLLPMRFMAVIKFTDKFMSLVKKTGIIHFVYSLFGVFVVEQGLGLNKNLKRAKNILKNKGVVAMFPEGRLNRGTDVALFKRGVSALALSNHTKVLPMHISIKEGNFMKFKRGSIVVNIGKAHYLETHSTYEQLAEGLRQEVIELGRIKS